MVALFEWLRRALGSSLMHLWWSAWWFLACTRHIHRWFVREQTKVAWNPKLDPTLSVRFPGMWFNSRHIPICRDTMIGDIFCAPSCLTPNLGQFERARRLKPLPYHTVFHRMAACDIPRIEGIETTMERSAEATELCTTLADACFGAPGEPLISCF